MTKGKIFFRADASAQIGYGHFVRTLALADMLKDDFECTFFTTSPSAYQIGEMEKVCRFVKLSEDDKFDAFLNLLKGDEIVVLDNYYFSTDYQRQIKDKGCKLVCIDDLPDRHFVCDVLINPALNIPELYDSEPYTRLCMGMDFAILRKPFLAPKSQIIRLKGTWLLAFGGTDFENMTEKFLAFLQEDSRVQRVTVITGDAYNYYDDLKNYSKAVVLKNLSADDMSLEMQRAEYAVLPSSTISIEALASGCKVANGYFVENQIETAEMYRKEGYCVGLGNLKDVKDSSFIDALLEFQPSLQFDFSHIHSRYIQLFKSL